jgi:CNT family concentrative nucleoside transporter
MTALIGIAVLPLIAFALSSNRQAVNLRTVGLALGIQVTIGGMALHTEWGIATLQSMSEGITALLGYSRDGIEFLFGGVVTSDAVGFVFAFAVLPVVVFFSSFIAVLYHLGVMQWLIRILGGGLRRALGTSHTESLSAAANIFVGQSEAPLVVRPYIPGMTISELFAVMVGGMASIAGSVMAGYVALGVPIEYLLAASFMAAPGGLLMAKLMEPETGAPVSPTELRAVNTEEYVNVIDAAASGASSGLRMAANIGAMLVAFVALIALVNGLLGYFGGWFGVEDITLQGILGAVFQPVAWVLGVPWEQAHLAGSLIGQKLILNEFVAYVAYADIMGQFDTVSQAIVVFALCGFANLSSIAILAGGLGAIAPTRRSDISRYGLRAVVAATLSNLMSAAIAGLFLSLS